jgi:formylglycine-generating enzyme required for sulfatase activity
MTKINKNIIIIYSFIFSFLISFPSFANDLKVENVSLTTPNAVNQTMKMKFDLSWQNSWRNSINYDAVWIFVKYSTDSGQTWKHATLAKSGDNPSGFNADSNIEVDFIIPSDKKGCFIQRSLPGKGPLELDDLQLVWDWGGDGLDASDSARIKVFGIEMVYVKDGAFYIGDGDGINESAYSFHLAGGKSSIQITSSLTNNIKVDAGGGDDSQLTGSGIGIDGGQGLDSNNDGIVNNSSFPTGYGAFYVMKYEITEGQWVDFFNTLGNAQKSNRDITGSDGKNSDRVVYRNTISWSTGHASTQRPNRAITYLSWQDLSAFADWAALRPLSELEYEKAARGENSPEYGEYAWGSASIIPALSISGPEDGTETIANDNANCNYGNQTLIGGDGGAGPLRIGIFATSNSNRQQSGGSYYGIMELTGNVSEAVVSLGSSQGRAFQASHGDGELLSSGRADNSDWPGFVNGEGVSQSAGIGLRGGSWYQSANLSLSARETISVERNRAQGGRCARTAP